MWKIQIKIGNLKNKDFYIRPEITLGLKKWSNLLINVYLKKFFSMHEISTCSKKMITWKAAAKNIHEKLIDACHSKINLKIKVKKY